MNINSKTILYFIGIGGISMSSLAAIAHEKGHVVIGSDRAENEMTKKLRSLGITVHIKQEAENIIRLLAEYDHDNILAVFTPAISEDNAEMIEIKKAGIPLVSRAELLGHLMLSYKRRLGIAGSHGKSTTTAMTDLILESGHFEPTVVEGAVMKELGGAYKVGKNDFFVFEACEYTDSFLSFFPTTAIITNVDYDHADYFHSVAQYIDSFGKYISLADMAVVNYDSKNCMTACRNYKGKLIKCSYCNSEADYYAAEIKDNDGFYSFTLMKRGVSLCDISLSVAGHHNVSNAVIAAAAALENGADTDAVINGLKNFKGVKRRFEYIRSFRGARLFDDYAHHPEEIIASLAAAKELGGRIICIYQPHSLSRTAELFDDFTKAFGDADIVVFADIYENLELDTGNTSVSSRNLSENISRSVYFDSFEKIAEYVNKIVAPGDIVITMGAGNIYKIQEMLK